MPLPVIAVLHADHVLVVFGVALVAIGLSSRLVKRHSLSPVLLALGGGVVVGPQVTNFVDPASVVVRGPLLEQTARVALAMSVFDIALRMRPTDLWANRARLGVLLGLVMPAMWVVTSVGAALLLGLSWPVAFLVGAALTPTDPAAASALVTGVLPDESLPQRVRSSLQLEAGANDGLALPFVLLAGSAATLPAGQVAGDWLPVAGRELAVALAVGAAAGLGGRWLADLADIDHTAEEDWFPLVSTGVALGVLGLAHLAGGSGVLAAFVAGLFFSEGLPEELRAPIHTVHRSLTRVALVVVFVVFGTVLPIDAWWPMLGGAGVVFGLWVLVLRRLPVAYPALRMTATGPLSAAFMGWSGPLGVAAIYYLTYIERYHLDRYEQVFAAGSLAVTASVLGHGVTSALAVRAYRRSTGVHAQDGESLEVDGPLP